MRNETAFARWREAAGPWAQWIKPSLFAQAPAGVEPAKPRMQEVKWAPPPGETALVLDLPGVDSIAIGCSLASRGYCPVPAFNTSPGVTGEVVKTWDIMAALLGGASILSGSPAGPPVFLLDAKRAGQGSRMGYETFDNRWYVFRSDLPSARYLLERGLRRLAVVCRRGRFGPDLRDALAEHRGVELLVLDVETGASAPFPPPAPRVSRVFSTLVRLIRRTLRLASQRVGSLDGGSGRPISHG